MNTLLTEIVNASESRYMSREEQGRLMAYAETLPQRFRASAAVEQAEDEIVSTVIEKLKQAYPNFGKHHDQAWEKGTRDLQLVLRHVTQAMVLDDVQSLNERLLYWFRTILMGVNITPQFIRDSFTMLREACRDRVAAEDFALLDPALLNTIEVLSDIPEPYTPAV